MTFFSSRVSTFKAWRAKRRAERPERLRRQAEAKAYRIEMKRRHESDPWGGAGGGR